jgi:hypothetical protein
MIALRPGLHQSGDETSGEFLPIEFRYSHLTKICDDVMFYCLKTLRFSRLCFGGVRALRCLHPVTFRGLQLLDLETEESQLSVNMSQSVSHSNEKRCYRLSITVPLSNSVGIPHPEYRRYIS